MEPTATTSQPDPQQATIEAMAGALLARDHCIAGQAALISQLLAENAAIRARLGAAKES